MVHWEEAVAEQDRLGLQGQTRLSRSPPGLLTLLSLGRSGQAVGSSRLKSSPSRTDEDLSEFREKASVSASCTCRERWQPQVTHGAGPPERCRMGVREVQTSTDGMPTLGRGPA